MTADEFEQRFWTAMDRKGLSGDPSDVWDALDRLVSDRERYHELLYAVSKKHLGETRHETALRYIREIEGRENRIASAVAAVLKPPPAQPSA